MVSVSVRVRVKSAQLRVKCEGECELGCDR